MRPPIKKIAATVTLTLCLCAGSSAQENCAPKLEPLIDDHVEALVRFKLKSAIPRPLPGMSEAALNRIEEKSRNKIQLQSLKAQYCNLLLQNLSPEERDLLLTFASTPSGAKALRQFLFASAPLNGALNVEILTATTSSFVEESQKDNQSR